MTFPLVRSASFRFAAVFAVSISACDPAATQQASSPPAIAQDIGESPPREIFNSSDLKTDGDSALAELRATRSAIVDRVALWKWIHAKPIEDPARESAVLDSVEKLAEEKGLDPAEARQFFESLMADARDRQHRLHDQWRTNGPPPLSEEIDIGALRQEIDRLTPRLLEAWGRSDKIR